MADREEWPTSRGKGEPSWGVQAKLLGSRTRRAVRGLGPHEEDVRVDFSDLLRPGVEAQRVLHPAFRRRLGLVLVHDAQDRPCEGDERRDGIPEVFDTLGRLASTVSLGGLFRSYRGDHIVASEVKTRWPSGSLM